METRIKTRNVKECRVHVRRSENNRKSTSEADVLFSSFVLFHNIPSSGRPKRRLKTSKDFPSASPSFASHQPRHSTDARALRGFIFSFSCPFYSADCTFSPLITRDWLLFIRRASFNWWKFMLLAMSRRCQFSVDVLRAIGVNWQNSNQLNVFFFCEIALRKLWKTWVWSSGGFIRSKSGGCSEITSRSYEGLGHDKPYTVFKPCKSKTKRKLLYINKNKITWRNLWTLPRLIIKLLVNYGRFMIFQIFNRLFFQILVVFLKF